jgi:hypothetical protein
MPCTRMDEAADAYERSNRSELNDMLAVFKRELSSCLLTFRQVVYVGEPMSTERTTGRRRLETAGVKQESYESSCRTKLMR